MLNTTQSKGQFVPTKKFTGFIARHGNINFHSNEAIIRGNQLTGLGFENVRFKMTVHEDYSIDFEEIGSETTSSDQRARFVDSICEKNSVPSKFGSYVLGDLIFTSTEKVGDAYLELFAAIESETPFDRLTQLLDLDIDQKNLEFDLSSTQANFLDELMNFFGQALGEMNDDGDEKIVDDLSSESKGENDVNYDYVNDSFKKMNQEKIEQLNQKFNEKIVELEKLENQADVLDVKIDKIKSEISLIESRLNDLEPNREFNGFYFFISESVQERKILEQDVLDLIESKISGLKGIHTKNFMKIFTQNTFIVNLGKKTDSGTVDFVHTSSLSDDLQDDLYALDIDMIDGMLVYTGDLSWSQLVNKLLKAGFHQDTEFDKLCGSNSYQNVK